MNRHELHVHDSFWCYHENAYQNKVCRYLDRLGIVECNPTTQSPSVPLFQPLDAY